jgi:hypothetical protein
MLEAQRNGATATPGSVKQEAASEFRLPSRTSAAVFLVKSSLLKIARALRDARTKLPRWPSGDRRAFPVLLAESRSPLRSEVSAAERVLQQGKVQNLRCAARHLYQIVIPARGIFSFWRQVGRATRRHGYANGRQLQEGCIMPAVGGGLCQLSNALYDLALRTGAEVIERHPHTRIVPGSAAAQGRDATVYWNYLDLRLRYTQPVMLDVQLTAASLIVRLYGRADAVPLPAAEPETFAAVPSGNDAQPSCLSCDVDACFRHRSPALALQPRGASEPTAYLLDEWSAEFELWLRAVHSDADALAIPFDGARRQRPRYAWTTEGYARIQSAPLETLWGAWMARRLAHQGAAWQQAQLQRTEAVARRLAAVLMPDCERVCVAQSLLPYLWRDGHLGGRRFTVLLSRQPIATLQANLDAAASLHPQSGTLCDFRAPGWLVEAEAEALRAAERVVTPHVYLAGLADLLPQQAKLLPWTLPATERVARGTPIIFPGPTVARKGAYELREAARRLDLEIVLLGRELEGAGFWDGVRSRRLRPDEDWLPGAGLVVQPAFVEDRPRALLRAIAAGIPVIATDRCGLGDRPGVTTVPCGDIEALMVALLAQGAGTN